MEHSISQMQNKANYFTFYYQFFSFSPFCVFRINSNYSKLHSLQISLNMPTYFSSPRPLHTDLGSSRNLLLISKNSANVGRYSNSFGIFSHFTQKNLQSLCIVQWFSAHRLSIECRRIIKLTCMWDQCADWNFECCYNVLYVQDFPHVIQNITKSVYHLMKQQHS